MILPKIFNSETNSFEPDLSQIDLSKWQVQGFQLNADGETYTINLEWKADYPRVISPAQGRAMLDKLGKLDLIESTIPQLPKKAKIFWEYATEWERTSPILNRLAPMIWPENTDDNLDRFFIEAKKMS